MKIAVCTIAYNEAEWIGRCIKQFQPFDLRHLVLISSQPWNGVPVEDDGSSVIANKAGAEVIVGHWPTEHEQRNFGLTYLYDYDWVLIVDADELYLKQDIGMLLKTLEAVSEPSCRIKTITYWKNTGYVFDPGDKHEPVMAVNPKKVMFYEHRQVKKFVDKPPEFNQYLMPMFLHHFSWAKSDKKIREKIDSFSHADQVNPNWYYDIWLKWTPESKMYVRAYGKERSIAKYQPCPKELIL